MDAAGQYFSQVDEDQLRQLDVDRVLSLVVLIGNYCKSILDTFE